MLLQSHMTQVERELALPVFILPTSYKLHLLFHILL